MAMTIGQWWQHARHRAMVAEDFGQWIGLLDENCEPLFDCPPPIEFSAPATRGAPVSGRFLHKVADGVSGAVHPLADELIADFGAAQNGQLIEADGPTRYIMVERPGCRRVYRITHTVARGTFHTPTLVEINGTDLLSILNRHVAWSNPQALRTGSFQTFTRDWVGDPTKLELYKTPRDLMHYPMVTAVDGVTMEGPAETVIRNVIATSLEIGFKLWGKGQRIVVSTASSGLPSPHLAYTADDQPLWDSIGALALQAGITVTCDLWFPSDPQPIGVKLLTQPTMIVRVTQG